MRVERAPVANYSTLADLDLAEMERSYGFHIRSSLPVAGGMANSSFQADTSAGMLVISILDNHNEMLARRLAHTTEFMHEQGVPTSEIVPRLDGDRIHITRGKYVLVKRWLNGETTRVVSRRTLPAAGRLLATIHAVVPTGLDVPVGSRRLSAVHREMLEDFPNQQHAAWVRDRLCRIDEYFPPLGDQRRSQWTTVHGDLNGPNIVLSPDGSLFAIDWETATVDDPTLDMGMSALDMCVTDGALDRSRLELFAHGYQQVGRTIDEELLIRAVEYASVIVAFHRYRRHNIRFPNPEKRDYYQVMVNFAEREFTFR